MHKYVWAGIYILVFSLSLEAQAFLPNASLTGQTPDVYRVVEKHNFRKRENGKYLGAAYREVRGTLTRESGEWYAGRFYILEETKRAAQLVAGKVDDSLPSRLQLGPLGAVRAGSPGRFPTMRDFPALPQENVSSGASWQAVGERILDPEFSGAITPVRVHVEYVYKGAGEYKGFPGHYLTAKYAVRYRRGQASASPELEEVNGTHDMNIFLPSEAGGPRMISETFREQYRYRGGRELSLEGTVLTVFEGVAPLNRPETAARIAEIINKEEPSLTTRIAEAPPAVPSVPSPPPAAAPEAPAVSGKPELPPPVAAGPQKKPSFAELPLPDIEVQGRDEGVALTINNLSFRPDSAQLLPSEAPRLEALAKALLTLPDRSFLVVGHSASTGRPAGEKELSIDRARAVAEALQKRGVPADKMVYEGRGSSEPVAPNDTESGRARNRRVEIIILD